MKALLVAALLALPLTSIAAENPTTTSTEVSKDWTQRRDEFVKASHEKLDKVLADVHNLEKTGKLVREDKAKKARHEAKDLKGDIADLKKDITKEAKKVSANDWEKERMDLQEDLNEIDQDYAEFTSLYRK